MNKKILLFLLIGFTAITRIYFCYDLPFSGDEVGVGILQATGQAVSYNKTFDKTNVGKIVSIDEIKRYIDYSDEYSVRDVLLSLRERFSMHPPFYYVVLHYTIKSFGNDVLVLRSLSIIFSLLSIIVIYQLGKAIFSQSAGLYSALLFAISPYCLQYNVMVRPYPLLTLLGLLSTLQIYLLIKNKSFNYSSIYLYLYILISVIGLYTMYHFVFIIFFQLVFVVLASPKNRNSIFTNLSVFILIFIFFIPWIPSLQQQLSVINGHDYYFHGKFNLFSFIHQVLNSSFCGFFSSVMDGIIIKSIKFLLTFILCIFFLVGCRNALKSKINTLLVISLVFYLLSHFAADWILKTNTLAIEKFQFFLIPTFLLFISSGLSNTSKHFYIKTFFVSLCCLMLIVGSIAACKVKNNFDGPQSIYPMQKLISENSKNSSKRLFVINRMRIREIFTFAHAIKSPADVIIIPDKKTISELVKMNSIKKYDEIYIVGLFVKEWEKIIFTAKRQEFITEILHEYDDIVNREVLLSNRHEITLINHK